MKFDTVVSKKGIPAWVFLSSGPPLSVYLQKEWHPQQLWATEDNGAAPLSLSSLANFRCKNSIHSCKQYTLNIMAINMEDRKHLL